MAARDRGHREYRRCRHRPNREIRMKKALPRLSRPSSQASFGGSASNRSSSHPSTYLSVNSRRQGHYHSTDFRPKLVLLDRAREPRIRKLDKKLQVVKSRNVAVMIAP